MVNSQESITAKLCTFARAYHSNFEKEKIFDDHLAYDLMGIDEYRQMGQLMENKFRVESITDDPSFKREHILPRLIKYISPIPLSRIAYTEGELLKFAKSHDRCQYVICGAGMDSFAFRNTSGNIEIYEIDHPDTQNYKKERIKALEWNIPENLHFAAVDFFVGVRDGPGKLLRLFLRHVQDIERHALGALVPDARHALKLLNEPGERSDIICGHIIRDRSGRECSFRR